MGGGRFCTFYGRLQSTFSPAAVRDNRVTTILRFHHFILDMLTAQLAWTLAAASAGDPTIDGLVMNDTDAIEALFRERDCQHVYVHRHCFLTPILMFKGRNSYLS